MKGKGEKKKISICITVAAALLIILGFFQKNGEKDVEKTSGAA